MGNNPYRSESIVEWGIKEALDGDWDYIAGRRFPWDKLLSFECSERFNDNIKIIFEKAAATYLVSALTGHVEGSRAFTRYRTIDIDMKKDLVKILEGKQWCQFLFDWHLTERGSWKVKYLIINTILFDCYLTEPLKIVSDSEFIANLQ